MSSVNEILDFWFGTSQADSGKARKAWFIKDPTFDQTIQTRFETDYQAAATGKLDSWQRSAQGCVALTLLLDQFPRNLFRRHPRAFATDAQALMVAEQAIAGGLDQELLPLQRWFLYIPYMHSENLDHQRQSVELFHHLRDADPETASAFPYAIKHLEIIEWFGRFPHRNQILDRVSTPEEIDFLKQPGSSF